MDTQKIIEGAISGIFTGLTVGVGLILANRMMNRKKGSEKSAKMDGEASATQNQRGVPTPQQGQGQFQNFSGTKPSRPSALSSFDFTTGNVHTSNW